MLYNKQNMSGKTYYCPDCNTYFSIVLKGENMKVVCGYCGRKLKMIDNSDSYKKTEVVTK